MGSPGQRHAQGMSEQALATVGPKSASSSPQRASRGKAAGPGRGPHGREHADWLVTLGEQLGGLQAQMASTASTSSLHALHDQGMFFLSFIDAACVL